METIKKWLKRIGSKKAMEERQRARLAGEINRPVKGPRGLRDCVQELMRRAGKATLTHPNPHVELPVTVIPSKDTTAKPQLKNWKNRGNSTN